MRTLQEDLDAAVAYHGHLCNGMVLGVRMARLGLQKLGIDDPLHYRDLVVYVEVDRCLADAVRVVTGCSLGKRRLKWVDCGKMAATFVDLATDRAIRIAVTGESRSPSKGENVVSFWQAFPDEEIFKWEFVRVNIPPEDLPGKPSRKVQCQICGEYVLDGREVRAGDKVSCRSCAQGAYYSPLE